MKRRTFLQSAVVGTASVGLAGCLGSSGETIQLAYVNVINTDENPNTVTLEILFDGETIVDETYGDLASDAEESVSSELPDDDGEYEITVDLPERDVETFVSRPAEGTGAECLGLRISIRGDDERPILQTPEEETC